jgi:hypothetical protein
MTRPELKEEFNLSFLERIQLFITGYTIKNTLKGKLYVFNCSIHGRVGTYKISGYKEKMYCPRCLEILKEEKHNGK